MRCFEKKKKNVATCSTAVGMGWSKFLGHWNAVSELKNVSETQMISKLRRRLCVANSDILILLWVEMLFKFQWKI